MFPKERLWEVKEYSQEKASFWAAELGISPLITGILLERGMDSLEAMKEFLYGSAHPFHNPFLMKDMARAVERIKAALKNQEQITVYGDYDVDGITASSLLYVFLEGLGARVNTYIPQRKSEGYGLNDDAIRHIYDQGTTLMITVDCGISGAKEVAHAPAGMDIIITDHHTVPIELPLAHSIINPKQKDCPYPFKDLSGVGLAFKLCQALSMKAGEEEPAWQDLVELVALGTVADIVPLLGENRELVRRGLKAMTTTRLVGLEELIKVSRRREGEALTTETIGFAMAPRLNAVGRLEHAQLAVELLVTKDREKAQAIAQELDGENSLRKEITNKIQAEAEAMLARQQRIETAIILASEGWHQGVIGIVASRLVEKYHLPTILMSINEGVAKGSCRSIPALNLYEAIASQSHLLTQFGGHHQAAGLTLPVANVEAFIAGFRAHVQGILEPKDYLPVQRVDAYIGVNGRLTLEDLDQLELLEPCGCQNPHPVFAFKQARLSGVRTIGSEAKHLQMQVTKGDYTYKATLWNQAALKYTYYEGAIVDIAFLPRRNFFLDQWSVQLLPLAVKSPLELWDFRQSRESRLGYVKSLLRREGAVAVYCQRQEQLQEKLKSEEGPSLAGLSFLEEHSALPCSTLVVYDLPQVSLKGLVPLWRQQGLKRLLLAYNIDSYRKAMAQLRLRHPDREQMTYAYKELMQALKQGDSLDRQEFLLAHSDLVSPAALEILEELAIISLREGRVFKGIIKKCSLQDSPLYCRLQAEYTAMKEIYSENIGLSQQELAKL